MALDRDQVRHVAQLARLRIPDEELDAFVEQMGQVLDYVAQLDELDVAGVEPMVHAADLHNVFADDAVRPSLDREIALANAPKRDDECFLVPAVL